MAADNIFLRRKFFISIVFVASCLRSNPQSIIPASLPKIAHGFIVVAHRGDHTQAPENTLTAFENAIREGVDYVEIDLRTTKDSQLIIMHDASVDRMTDGKGFVKDLVLDDIHKLKVKNKTHPEWGEHSVPTFREVLALCRNKINIYLDFKNADPGEAYKQLLEYDMEKQVLVYINNEDQFHKWRKLAPQIPLMLSLPDDVKDDKSVKVFLDKTGIPILDGGHAQYSSAMVKAAMEMGCIVVPDIQQPVEDAPLWESAIKKGISGLQTDHPVALINFLTERKIR